MKSPLFILIILFCFSCVDTFDEKEIIGIYTPIDYKHTFDTIQLDEKGVYYRKVYDKDKKLLLNLKSNYELRNGGSKIYFNSYFLNLDRDLVKFPELVNDTLGGAELNLERKNHTIKFCTGHFSASLPDQNCYQKIKQ